MREAKMLWTEVLAKIQGICNVDGGEGGDGNTGGNTDAAFTTENLSEAAGMDPVQAARWLTKFVDWGYIRRGEFETGGPPGRRPRRLYHILKRGVEKNLEDIKKSDVSRLMEKIAALVDAHGEKAEARALRELIGEYHSVLKDQEERLEKKPGS